ncbi:MAG: DNA-directed RNA polymerase subunit beta [Armatimonadota bacterium]|nr:DNA-directed RNA polymerase subunit beta [Armatimonadota bacterium]
MKEIQHRTKRTPEVLDLPNLVEIQLNSYKWFLKEGLRELFRSFSPITDFTGNLSLELVDYTLGEPKYSVEECRYRDMTTYEAQIKARVKLTTANNEVIESDVYLGELPLMTERGTFVINGAERVVVSQLTRSPGVYFKDNLDYTGRVLYYATIIPSPGAWIEIETDASDVIYVHVAQTKKFPLTVFLRALNQFEQACPKSQVLPAGEALGRTLAADYVHPDTGEVLFAKGSVVDEKMVRKLHSLHLDERVEVEMAGHPCGTTVEILELFGEKEVLRNLDPDSIKGRRPTADIRDPKTDRIIVRAGHRITEEAAKRIIKMGLTELEVFVPNRYIDATLDQDPTNTSEEALLDIYKRIRPGDPATRDSARTLMESYFFDHRRYDLGKVGRYKLNKKLGLNLPEHVRVVTREDVIKIIRYIIGLSESGTMVTHLDSGNLKKRLPELEEAVQLQEQEAAPEEKEYGGRVWRLRNSLEFLKNVELGTIFTESRLKDVRKLLELIPHGTRLVSDSPAELYSETAIRLTPCATDDIDHLENKRVRSVGELLQDQLRMGFLRMEKVAKERMTSLDPENVIPQVVLSVKPISAAIKSFFGSSQLSQFMDQTNPLAELTHKRRLSALGPGGLSRQSAKLEVRDVHYSHYGRICPIETPEGPNIGLIGSMATYARIDEYGFLRTPYRKVRNGRVTDEIVYLSADEEDHEYVAPASTPFDPETGEITVPQVIVRHEDTYPQVPSNKVTYMDVSPAQIMSVAAALIPFLENDDANRALMGSNMQRQAVPLIRSEAPLVRTGVEARAARDSGTLVIAKRNGTVRSVTAERILIEAEDGTIDEYKLVNLLRSNQGTCITQKPLVKVGNRVKAGQVIADGPSTSQGILALGQNVLVAFMPWHGYNYEDAVLVSQRLVKDDVYTSIHIEKYETEARDTKLGPEEITRDIPNVGEDALKDLDENGIVRIGAEVGPEDILVGKVAPKGQSELTAEERLIIAIFGKKAEETRDVSLRVPHGEGGTVIDVKVFSRFKFKCKKCGQVFNFSKKPDRLFCERCEGELERLNGDELPAGVNQLVRVYLAQKRRLMEGDKMAGRHGNKGVISRILPEEDMPFLPDGTPVDIVLNPLGVPSRMNIGQILETHQGMAAKYLGCAFRNPIFQGSTEDEILADLKVMAWKLRLGILRNYLKELGLSVEIPDQRAVDTVVDHILARIGDATKEELPGVVQPIVDLYDQALQKVGEHLRTLDAASLEALSIKLAGPPVVDDPMSVRNALSEAARIKLETRIAALQADSSTGSVDIAEINRLAEEKAKKAVAIPHAGEPVPPDYPYHVLLEAIDRNVQKRLGYDPNTGKCAVYDGRTGQKFSQDVTVGYIYMMKLLHLVEDKIHARSTGPYSLVTQQPLGGKAQFGGQRFGEMEVWALEAYGAAYTLQEMLTIKSDDVQGRVKTYESIVKGENIQEPGIPESFKILVNELQSLCLKVTVEDDRDHVIDLKDTEEEFGDSGEGVISAKRRRIARELREDYNG